MVITHHGGQCVKVSLGDTTIVFDPIGKGAPVPPSRFGADIAFISLFDPLTNGAEQVAYGEKDPFVIDGPGEYEVGRVLARGYGAPSTYGGKERITTVYLVTLEGMTIAFLGALGMPELPQEAREAIEHIDILFVPIGGDGVLTPAEAHKLSVKLEPSIIVPIHFDGVGEKGSLEAFLKEASSTATPVDKLTLKKKDLDGKEAEVVVIKS